MKINLFDIGLDGQPKITKHVKDIWYLNAILEKYGEENAIKLFKIFDFTYNLNPQENPFANLPEDTKFETIFRSTYPELEALIDMNDDIIESAIDLVGELYETNNYRAYKAIKIAYEKIIKELEFTHISLNKEDGNMAEINKALNAFEDLKKKLSSSYKELEEEMNVKQARGGGQVRRRQQEELE
jgi:hypothetical protein